MEFDWDFLGDCWVDKKWVDISNVEVYKKLGRKLLSKNLHLNTFHESSCSVVLATKLCPLQQVRVLILHKCQELEDVDLWSFLNLRYFNIRDCVKFKVVHGWAGAKGLGWIEIKECPSYCSLLDVQFFFSLKELCFIGYGGPRILWQLANFSQCVQLRRLEICYDNDLVESMDLKALRFLEVLSFEGCRTLSTIHGLSGLQNLIKLNVEDCTSLKTVPELGCLKVLTYLNMSWSGIVEVLGVQELHLLTFLDLSHCKSLESLPPLSHLKALVFLDLTESYIEEIFGVEDLVNLKTLCCIDSKLKQLSNLDHLRRLCVISDDTRVFKMDPSRSFIRGFGWIDNDRTKEGLFLDDVSDFSGTNDS